MGIKVKVYLSNLFFRMIVVRAKGGSVQRAFMNLM